MAWFLPGAKHTIFWRIVMKRYLVFILLLMAFTAQVAWGQYFAKPEELKWQKTTATFTVGKMTPGPWAKVVNDPTAVDGKAVAVTAGEGRDCHMVSGGWMPVSADAKYTMAFHLRMKMADIAIAEKAHVLYAGTEGRGGEFYMPSPLRLEAIHRTRLDDPSTESVVQWYFVDAPSLDAVKDYHDYTIKFERPVSGFIGFRIYWFGRVFCSAWVDQVKVLEEPLPSEAEQLKSVKLDGKVTVNHQTPATLVCTGPFNWTYHIPDCIGGKCAMTGKLPDTVAELSKYDVVLISEVMLGNTTPTQRLLLSEFVKAGGGLVLLGGFSGYGKSRVHVSPLLMDLLPVNTRGMWDLHKAPNGGLLVTPADQRFHGLSWTVKPRVYYYHDVTVKNGAKTWLNGTASKNGKAVTIPLLVTRPYGNGTVIAFLGTEMGDPQPGQTAIWAWKDWGRLLTIAVNAARGKEDAQGTELPQWVAPSVKTIPPPPDPEPKSYPGERFTSTQFEIAKVWPTKICYRPGSWASGYITLINGTDQPVTGKLTVTIHSGMADVQPLLTQNVSVKAGGISKVPVVWKIGEQEEFGRELYAELTDGNGNILDNKGAFFTIGWNNYRLGQCQLVQPWTWEPSKTQIPDITPLDRWYVYIPRVRQSGSVVTEYFFWAPDDFGNLTPEEDRWISGQSEFLCSQADLHAVIDAAHENGIAAVTYGKNIMSITGRQVKRDGLELTRMHPEWCQWVVNGEPKWLFDVDRYRYNFEQAREKIQLKGRQDWFSNAVDCDNVETVQYGADEIIRSAKKYGWDGVRFDDHFTLESCWDGGINFDGSSYERGGDFEALSARNNRIMIDTAKAYNPHFLLGYNYAANYTGRGIRYPEAFAETCRDGQFVMVEWSSWWPQTLKTWGNVAATLAGENHRVQQLGGVPGMMPMGGISDEARRWEAAINYASQGHYYNAPSNTSAVKNTLFMLRYGDVLYNAKTLFRADGEKLFHVDTAGKCLWKPFIHERTISDTARQLSVSVLNMDPDAVVNETKAPRVPLAKATVTFNVPTGWKITRAWLLDPDGKSPCVEVKVPATEGKVPVELTNIQCWNLLVFELAKL